MRTKPYFFDAFPSSKRPDYPRQRGEMRAAVVVVGGGLTGCACAASFAVAGVDVVLLEADRLGAGATGASAGLVRQDFDASFQETAALHGVRTARHVWQGFRRAALDFGAALRRLGVRADVASQDVLFLTRDGADAAKRLQREYQGRRDAGVDASWLNPRAVAAEAHLTAGGAIRTKADVIDP